MFLCSMGMFSSGFYCLERCNAQLCSGLSRLQKEKSTPVSAKVIKTYQEEFLFGARKSIFSGMRRLRFLSEGSLDTVTFASIYFIFLLLLSLFLFLSLHVKQINFITVVLDFRTISYQIENCSEERTGSSFIKRRIKNNRLAFGVVALELN